MKRLQTCLGMIVMCVGLSACSGMKVNYNSPLTPQTRGPLSVEAQKMFGHWTWSQTIGGETKHTHLYIGKTVLPGRDVDGKRTERLILITMDPDKPMGWQFLQAHITKIGNISFLNVSTALVESGDGWNFKTYEISEDLMSLTMSDVGVFSIKRLSESALIKFDKSDEGKAVSDFIRRYGVQGLLTDKTVRYLKTGQ